MILLPAVHEGGDDVRRHSEHDGAVTTVRRRMMSGDSFASRS